MDRLQAVRLIDAKLGELETLVEVFDLDTFEEHGQLSHVGISVLNTMQDISDWARMAKIERIAEIAELLADEANWQQHEIFRKKFGPAPDQRGGGPAAGFDDLEEWLEILRYEVEIKGYYIRRNQEK